MGVCGALIREMQMQALGEERQRAERAERDVAELQAAQGRWEQELASKEASDAEQVLPRTPVPYSSRRGTTCVQVYDARRSTQHCCTYVESFVHE